MKNVYSLKNKNQFNDILKNGSKVRNNFFFVAFKKQGPFLIGISVPKKHTNAVNRNLQKRQVKKIIDEIGIFYELNCQMVIILSKEWMKLSYADKKTKIKELIAKLK